MARTGGPSATVPLSVFSSSRLDGQGRRNSDHISTSYIERQTPDAMFLRPLYSANYRILNETRTSRGCVAIYVMTYKFHRNTYARHDAIYSAGIADHIWSIGRSIVC